MPDSEIEQETPTRFSSSPTQHYRLLLSPLIPILLESLKIIFIDNPKLFLLIYALTALPLSLLLTSLSLSSRSLKAHVAHLEWLAQVVPVWVEADNVRDEARTDSLALLRIKARHAAPILPLSLLAVISTVVVARRGNPRPTVSTIVMAVKVTWVRPMLTCMVNFVAQLVWTLLVDVLAKAAGYPAAVALVVMGAVVEVYLMAVLSLGLVVSVAEERVGLDAVKAGLGLMKGRRVCGWVLSGLILLGPACIGREMEGLMEGWEWGPGRGEWTVEMRVGYMSGLVVLLGWVVLWSYVVATVFYCECRKINVMMMVKEEQLDG